MVFKNCELQILILKFYVGKQVSRKTMAYLCPMCANSLAVYQRPVGMWVLVTEIWILDGIVIGKRKTAQGTEESSKSQVKKKKTLQSLINVKSML